MGVFPCCSFLTRRATEKEDVETRRETAAPVHAARTPHSGGCFVVCYTAPVRKRTLPVLSASSLAVLRECPRCFWLQLHERLRRPSGPFPSLPAGMDGILKDYFDRYRVQGTLPPDIAGSVRGKLFPDVEKLAVWRNARRGLRHARPDLGVELMGALDDLLQEDEKVTPLDYKTRGYALKEDTHRHYQHQMDLYAYLLEHNGFRTTGRAVLLFIFPDTMTEGGLIKFTVEPKEIRTDVSRAEALLREASRVLSGPLPARHSACAFCLYASDWASRERAA